MAIRRLKLHKEHIHALNDDARWVVAGGEESECKCSNATSCPTETCGTNCGTCVTCATCATCLTACTCRPTCRTCYTNLKTCLPQ